MDGENRKIPGDRLVSRILTRASRRPRLGLSPDFYARFGMSDPWSARESVGEQPAANDGMVFLSAQPYYAMMRRLAAARRRRERRDIAFQARHPGAAAIRAVARHWPGETATSLTVSRLARLALDQVTLPPPAAPAAPVVVEQGAPTVAAAPYRRAGSTFTSRGANAWWSTPFVPARVFGRSDPDPSLEETGNVAAALPTQAPAARSPARRSAAEHAGARVAAALAHTGAAARAIAEAVPASPPSRHLARVVQAIESLPPDEQQVQLRRVIRRLGASAPAVRTVFDQVSDASDTSALRPAQVAARRADPMSRAGLRPVLSRSPAMALASAPEVDRAASGTLATAERSADSSGRSASLGRLPRRAAATQRALARAASVPTAGVSSVPAPVAYARAATTAALSASPVLRPAATQVAGAAPRIATAVSRRVVSPAGVRGVAVSVAPAAPRMPASARAVARYVASLLPAEAPRVEPANGAVRTARGTWVAARSVLASERDPAIHASVRHQPASAHAAARVDAGQVQGRSVLPRAVANPERLLASLSSPAAPSVAAALSASPVRASTAPAARSSLFSASAAPTGSTPVRTVAGTWVAARSPEGRAAVGLGGDRLELGPRTAGPAALASARTLVPSAFRTAEPLAPVAQSEAATEKSGPGRAPAERPSSAGQFASPSAVRAASSAAWVQPTAARPSGIVHAAARGSLASAHVDSTYASGALASAPSSRIVAATPTGSVLVAPASSGSPAAASRLPRSGVGAPSVAASSLPGASADRGVGVAAFRASTMRAPPMAHASARTEIPLVGSTLQPQVSPRAPTPRAPRASPHAAPAAAFDAASNPAFAPGVNPAPNPARARASLSARVSTVAAAARIDALLTGAFAANRVAVAPASERPGLSRFARSGPLSFALPPLIAGPEAPPGATRGLAGTAGLARARVRTNRVFSTPDSAWSPSSAVTTPSGIWISARAAAATPGMRIVRTEGGRLVALAPPPDSGTLGAARPGPARAAATAGAAFARPFAAPTDDAADALVAPAPAARRRASDWAAERHRVGEATAYRGAYRVPEQVDPGAPVYASAPGEREPARATRTPARRDRPRRIAATTGDMALPNPMVGVGPGAVGAPVATHGPAPTLGVGTARAPLEQRLHGVAAGSPDRGSPSWAARSDGVPRVRSPGGLFEALARATSTEEIVRVIYARADGVRETPLATEAPVVQVIEQIRQEVRREQAVTELATRAPRLYTPASTTLRGNYVQPVRSTTRVNRGGVAGVNATARSMSAGSGDDRIMKLVKKLQGLIHLAEAEGRLADARSQVRMAEDSAAAVAEGQGPVAGPADSGGRGQKQDIEALGREVLEVVTRELEFRRSRRVEDHDESNWW